MPFTFTDTLSLMYDMNVFAFLSAAGNSVSADFFCGACVQ